MSDINRVILVGRLTRDAELRYTNGGMAISKFSVAVNGSKKEGDIWVDDASFFDIVYMGKAAEAVNQYIKKGSQIAIDGKLKQNRWDQEGQSRSKIEVVANHVQLLGGGKKEGKRPEPQAEYDKRASEGFEDDIPF